MMNMPLNKRQWLVLSVLFCASLTITMVVKSPLSMLNPERPLGTSMLMRTGPPQMTNSTLLPDITIDSSSYIAYNLTIISAYFNLGKFKKGSNSYFTTDLYRRWASPLCRMHNPLVFYTDMPEFKNLMTDCRSGLKSITRIVTIENRTSLWSFQLRPKIKEIFDNPNYPKHHPNTVLPDYPCVQHAKYELVADTIKNEIFKTSHYAWLDVGYFRDIANSKDRFILDIPTDLNSSKVAYTLVENGPMDRTPQSIFYGNIYWVGGGMFLGQASTLLKYIEQYRRAVLTFLQEKLMNSDQQVVYSMFTDTGRKKIQPEIEPQLFVPRGKGNPWFYLGYLCLRKLNKTEVINSVRSSIKPATVNISPKKAP